MVTQVPSGGLTSVEQLLVEHVGRGEWLDLIPSIPRDEAVDEATMRSWGDSQTCSARVIRDILRGRLVADPDPHGLRLRGARISGRLDLENLTTDVNLELNDCFLEAGVVARDARLGSVGLTGCRIERLAESPLAEPPLAADRLTCRGLGLFGARVIGDSDDGVVNLSGAHIAGPLECGGAKLCNKSGPALMADGLQVDQDMFLRGGFTATGSGDKGAVRLRGGHIGNLECDGAKLRNECGPALVAELLRVDQNMFLRDGFTATGSGDEGAVNLSGAHIGGYLDFSRAELHNSSGPALNAVDLQVDQDLNLTDGFTATGGDKGVAVDLTGARVGGVFQFAPERLEHKAGSYQLTVDGLTYAGVPEPISAGDWLKLLRHGTPGYAAQPYQELAAAYRAQGDERQVRKILMKQRDHQLARAGTSWRERWWGRITKVTLGYGYRPWLALWFLAAVVVLSCLLAVVLGAHGALAQTDKTAHKGRSCTVIQQVSVGLDLNLPVGTSVARAQCDLTTDSGSVTAFWLTAVGWVLRVLAWVFAALFIAGFTSAVRKT